MVGAQVIAGEKRAVCIGMITTLSFVFAFSKTVVFESAGPLSRKPVFRFGVILKISSQFFLLNLLMYDEF